MRENVVSNLRLPRCAKIEKVITCPEYGEVAATLTWNGNELTFFRTDFLDFSRVSWYFAEKFSANDYHEVVPREVIESIRKNGGFFLSKHFMTIGTNNEVVFRKESTISRINYEAANCLLKSVKIPGLKTELMYGVVYDVLGRWLLETGTLSEEEWLNSPNDEMSQQELLHKDRGGWNVEELLGNIFVREWTQEKYGQRQYIVTRSGVPHSDGEGNYPSRMRYAYAANTCLDDSGIRAFLYFKQ